MTSTGIIFVSGSTYSNLSGGTEEVEYREKRQFRFGGGWGVGISGQGRVGNDEHYYLKCFNKAYALPTSTRQPQYGEGIYDFSNRVREVLKSEYYVKTNYFLSLWWISSEGGSGGMADSILDTKREVNRYKNNIKRPWRYTPMTPEKDFFVVDPERVRIYQWTFWRS